MHDGFTNKFTFVHKDHKTTLAPLALRKVSEVQLKMRKKRKAERKEKESSNRSLSVTITPRQRKNQNRNRVGFKTENQNIM